MHFAFVTVMVTSSVILSTHCTFTYMKILSKLYQLIVNVHTDNDGKGLLNTTILLAQS